MLQRNGHMQFCRFCRGSVSTAAPFLRQADNFFLSSGRVGKAVLICIHWLGATVVYTYLWPVRVTGSSCGVILFSRLYL